MSDRRPYRYWEDPAWVADSDPKVVAKIIRDQRDLLDECEMLISGLECRCDGMNRCARCVTLDKLRGQEKDR